MSTFKLNLNDYDSKVYETNGTTELDYEVVVADEQTAEAERVRLQAEEEMKASRIMWAIQEGANIVDNTVKYF